MLQHLPRPLGCNRRHRRLRSLHCTALRSHPRRRHRICQLPSLVDTSTHAPLGLCGALPPHWRRVFRRKQAHLRSLCHQQYPDKGVDKKVLTLTLLGQGWPMLHPW